MVHNTHLKRFLERKQAEHKEDIAREVKTYGQVRPPEHQLGTRTWKSYSKIRFGSAAFRSGWERVFGRAS